MRWGQLARLAHDACDARPFGEQRLEAGSCCIKTIILAWMACH